MQFWRLAIASEFPREHCCMTFVVAERLAVGRLMLLAKMPTSRFVALERVPAHQLGEFEEIGNAPGAFEGLVKIFVTAQDAHILPEFFSQRRRPSSRWNESSDRVPFTFSSFSILTRTSCSAFLNSGESGEGRFPIC